MTRTELKLNVDPKKAMDVIFDMTRRSEFDENFLEVNKLIILGQNCRKNRLK